MPPFPDICSTSINQCHARRFCVILSTQSHQGVTASRLQRMTEPAGEHTEDLEYSPRVAHNHHTINSVYYFSMVLRRFQA